jgi:hypothetical protein
VLGYVEGITDGSGLRRLAALGKPVALLVAGRSAAGQRAAASHTGALANGRGVVEAALSQYGIVAVDDVDELLGRRCGVRPAAPAGRTPRRRSHHLWRLRHPRPPTRSSGTAWSWPS